MKKNIFVLLGICFLLALTYFVVDRFALFQKSVPFGEVQGNGAPSETSAPESVPYIVEEMVHGLEVPWSIAFTAPNRILVTERPGRLRVIFDGVLQEKPLQIFSEVVTGGEEGLMGLALDPDYAENKLLYLSLAYEQGGKMYVEVLRFRDADDHLEDRTLLIDHIPAAQFHAGSRIAFGPDDKLYITTGDATERNFAQDLKSLAGKILRLNPDGSIPAGNPFPESPVWSYGHRNPQGISWHPETGELYETEHGPSVFDGPAGGDEVNHITKGANYGWPLVSHEKKKEGTVAPLLVFTPAEAPSSLLIYSGKVLPQFQNDLFFGALVGEGLMRLKLDPQNPDKISAFEKLKEVQLGRIRAVTEGPDGFIYFSTSNRDGRGKPQANDDRIFRIRPR